MSLTPSTSVRQDQLFGLQSTGDGAGHQIRIDIERLAVFTHADRCDNRDKILLLQGGEYVRVDALHLADPAQVDQLRRRVFQHILGGFDAEMHLFGADQVPVAPGQPDGPAAAVVDQADDLLVHPAHQNHLHHIHGFAVRDPHPLHITRFYVETVEQQVDLGTAAVNDNHLDADLVEQDHIECKLVSSDDRPPSHDRHT